MFLQKFKTPGIAHVAYLLGDQGQAALVDPRRDISEYLEVAQAQELSIRYVIETHRQEDFVIGSAEAARLTKAKVVTLDHPLFGHSDVRLTDGQELRVGGLTLRALHTPGHTPESTCYAVFVDEAPHTAWGVFTGDTLFIGETGRTDLPDAKRTGHHAGELFDAVHHKLLPLGDQTLVWPAHGSGSVCGGNIADRDDSTLGLERTYNPVFTQTRQTFVAAKIEENIPRPPYFTRMEQVNLTGGLPLDKTASSVALLSAKTFAVESERGVVIDTREPEAFAAGHLPGSLNIWLAGLPVFAGWFPDVPKVYIVVGDNEELAAALIHLARIGVDNVEGALIGGFDSWKEAGLPLLQSGTIDALGLQAQLSETLVLDVREDTEFKSGHIEGARHLFVGYVQQHITRLKADLESKPNIVVTCGVGHRAGVAVSVLERQGYKNVTSLLGGMKAWSAANLPLVKDSEHHISTTDIEGERA